MAAAGPPVAKFSNLFGQADLWDSPDVDMAPVCTVLGSASTADHMIKTNICVLASLTMGTIANLIGMQDRFSNKLHCWFLGKTIQNYVANTRIMMSNDQLGFCVSNYYSVKIDNQC